MGGVGAEGDRSDGRVTRLSIAQPQHSSSAVRSHTAQQQWEGGETGEGKQAEGRASKQTEGRARQADRTNSSDEMRGGE